METETIFGLTKQEYQEKYLNDKARKMIVWAVIHSVFAVCFLSGIFVSSLLLVNGAVVFGTFSSVFFLFWFLYFANKSIKAYKENRFLEDTLTNFQLKKI